MFRRIQTPVIILGFSLLSAGGYLWLSYRTYGFGFPLDDAWIHQTYARNLALNAEWAFIPGIPSAGSTSPLWSGVLALGPWIGLDPKVWSYLSGIALLVLTGWMGYRWYAARSEQGRVTPLVVGVVIVSEWHLVWASLSGMETIVLALLAVSLFYFLESERVGEVLLGLLIGAGVWIRPDALTFILPVLFHILIKNPTNRLGRFLRLTMGISLLVVPYLAFNFQLSGALWPSTLYAKQAEYSVLTQRPLLLRIGEQFTLPLVGVGVVLLPGVFIDVVNSIRKERWDYLAPLIWASSFLGLYALRLPVIYQHGRYAMPVIPVLIIIGALGMNGWIHMRGINRLRWMTSRAWPIIMILVGGIFGVLGGLAYSTDVAIIETEMVQAAAWIAENTEPDTLIAAHDIGALGYFGSRNLVDLAGLISPEVVPIINDERALEEFLDSSGAEILMTFPNWYPELVTGLELLYSTGSEFSPRAGGENMAVFRWR